MFRASLRLARQAAAQATRGIAESITNETTYIASRQIVARVESQAFSTTSLTAQVRGKFPTRQPRTAAEPAADVARLSTSTSAAAAARSEEQMRAHAAEQAALHTPWMFPWERRQLRGAEDGKGLRTWEKLYWGVFVTAISVYLFSRLLLPNKKAEEDPEIAASLEAKKVDMARLVLADQKSFTQKEADVFEGLNPEEIQEFVEKVTGGAKASDPFEGMSPEEINDWMKRNGTAGLST